MQLIYRGVRYNYQPADVEIQPGAIAGKYRGSALHFRNATAKLTEAQPALRLIYRGTQYSKGVTQSATVAQPIATAQKPFELIYRGVRYQSASAKTAQVNPIQDDVREVAMKQRLNHQKRELAVLGRFEDAIAAPTSSWVHYNNHQGSMS
ncbi:MAG: DUF4278 domain-containing protein [Oscillatoriales cyanobacterium C42_A2020_001]|nr:DUF4278 domain-containing protein [Leptolyngbyaceae cyanobacterium C42_A2020_001]